MEETEKYPEGSLCSKDHMGNLVIKTEKDVVVKSNISIEIESAPDKKYLQGRFCGVGRTKCKFHTKDPVLAGTDVYCEHPVFLDGEPLSSVPYPYCAYEKYTEIAGKWVWNEDLGNYLWHIIQRLEYLNSCIESGVPPQVNSSMLEEERCRLHNEILDNVREERGSEWEKVLKQYVEEKASEIMKVKAKGTD